MHIQHSFVRSHLARAFTLTELLVVIAIIAVLAGLLLPVLSNVQEEGRKVKCMSNNKQLGLAWRLFVEEHDGKLPGNYSGPSGVAVDSAGLVYFTEFFGNVVKRVGADGSVTTIAGNGGFGKTGGKGPALDAVLGSASGVALGAGGKV